ncbi:MAG: aminotransferase class V-fold PLP-dependent enzyme [Candidatus Lokiarchaeota archaeon]|nr:aminotransferase class V-fold PLP-dependent enzyme [Candidatus Lokiarchaeota archaeon]MBD3199450.1 aminotransferase class V-fold PLP-dependent enzyme [Candidatus Lokiarchaeota archaeon]
MNIDWNEIRETEYSTLQKNKFIYFLNAGSSLMNQSAYNEGIKYFKNMKKYGDINYEIFFEKLEEIRIILSEYINAKTKEIAFMINTSSGLLISAYILNDQRGKILYPSLEFPTSIHIFKRLGYDCIKIDDLNGTYPISLFRDQLDDKTKYIIHSHVQSFNGFRQDLTKLGDFCHQNALINIINATQSIGAFNIDVKRDKINILAANALKWFGSGYGIGILYISDEIINKNQIPISGWLSVENPFEMDNENIEPIKETRSMDSFGGCPNFASLLSLGGSLDLIKNRIGSGDIKQGISRIQKRIVDLTSFLLEQLQEFNFKILTPTKRIYRSGIITIENKNAKQIHNYLKKNKIFSTLKKYPNSKNETLIRFAINYYNNYKDIEVAIKTLKNCRFL